MTVQAAIQMWSANSGSLSSEDGRRREAEITTKYSIVADPTDDKEDVLLATDLPLLGDRYKTFPQIRVVEKVATQASPVFWHVDVVYKGEFGPTGAADNPLNIPPIIQWSSEESNVPVTQDINGNPLVTVLGEPLPGATFKRKDLVCRIERNYASVNLAATQAYLESVNSDVLITGHGNFAPGLCRLMDFSSEFVFHDNVPGGGYSKVHAEIRCRNPYNTSPDKAWWDLLRHEGYKFKTPDGRIVHATDDNDDKESKPVLLTADGSKQPNPAAAIWLPFNYFLTLPYSALGLF